MRAMTGSKASQDAKPSDEPLAALTPAGDDSGWPTLDKSGKPDEPHETGAKDDRGPMPGDATVPAAHRHAAPVSPAPHQAASANNFPLWPDSPGAGRSAGEHLDRRVPASRRAPKPPRRPLVGIPLMVVLALVALLFGWLGAEPFWLAVHHSDAGTLTITSCTGSGVDKHCTGRFVPADHHYTVGNVTAAGAQAVARPGVQVAARMVSESGRLAYVGDGTGLLLRWTLPLAAVLACGLLIGLATGAWRLRGRSRFGAVTLSLLGPLAIAGCVLALTW